VFRVLQTHTTGAEVELEIWRAALEHHGAVIGSFQEANV